MTAHTPTWAVDDAATVWRGSRPSGIFRVAAVENGVVTLTDGSRWGTSGGPLQSANFGARIAHTLTTDADGVAHARAVARIRELFSYVFTGRRPYRVPGIELSDLERILTRMVAHVVRHNFRGTDSDRVDREIARAVAALEVNMHRAEAVELEGLRGN